jgi:hypothetical protein
MVLHFASYKAIGRPKLLKFSTNIVIVVLKRRTNTRDEALFTEVSVRQLRLRSLRKRHRQSRLTCEQLVAPPPMSDRIKALEMP